MTTAWGALCVRLVSMCCRARGVVLMWLVGVCVCGGVDVDVGVGYAASVLFSARFMVHDVFMSALANFHHFLLLPVKCAGLAVAPIAALIYARYEAANRVTRALRGYQAGVAQRAAAVVEVTSHTATHNLARHTLRSVRRFDTMHNAAVAGAACLVTASAHHAALAYAGVNAVALTAMTGGAPIMAIALGAVPMRLVNGALLSLVLPGMAALNVRGAGCVCLCMPCAGIA